MEEYVFHCSGKSKLSLEEQLLARQWALLVLGRNVKHIHIVLQETHMTTITSVMPMVAAAGAMVASVDVDGFLTSQSFLATLANFISTIILSVVNVMLSGLLGITG